MSLYAKLAGMISTLSYNNFQQYKMLQEHKRAEEALKERVKEWAFMQSISKIIQKQNSFESICQKIACALPNAFYYPEIACARILCEGKSYQTDTFYETEWCLSADLKVVGKSVGTVEVFYLEERPTKDEGPFVKEERDLLNFCAERLGRVSERKRAEEEIRKFKIISDNAVYGNAIADLQGNLLYTNRFFANSHGYEPEELIGKNLSLFHSNEQKETVDRLNASMMLEGHFLPTTVWHRHKDGTEFPMLMSGVLIKDDYGNPQYIAASAIDITAQHKAEDALREMFQRLEFALQGGRLGLWDWNPQDGSVVYSDLWAQILEYQPDEVEPTVDFFKQHVHPDDLSAVLDRLTGHVDGRLPVYESEHRFRTKSGKWLWVLDRGKIVERDKDGQPVRVTGVIADITDRKRVEAALKESEERFSLAMDASKDGIWDWDLTTGSIYCSPALTAMLGYDSKEVIENVNQWQELIHPEDRQKAYQANMDCVNGRTESFEFEYRMQTRDGGWKWILGRGRTVYRDASGRAMRMTGTHQDITERKRVEEELRESKAILQAAMNQSQAGIAIADAPSGRLRYVNDAGLLIRGENRETVVNGIGVDEYVSRWMILDLDGTPLSSDQVPLTRAILYGETSSREFIIRRSEHDDRVVWANAAPIRNEQGQVTAGIVVFHDITDGKKAEEALRESEKKFVTLFTSMTEMVVLHELVYDKQDKPVNYRIIDCNTAFTRITNIPRKNAVGRLATEVYGTDTPPYLDEYSTVALSGEQYQYETYFEPMDKHFIISVVSPQKNHFATITTDITKSKQAEAEKEKLLVQLAQAQKMESVGRLAGGVAHDFNNMLGVILGQTEMALEDEDPATPLYASLQTIQQAAKRSADLTHQLLAFSRKQTVAPKVLDLNETISSMLKMLLRLIGEDIDLAWKPGQELWLIKMDPAQIDQILANLCVNARDAIAGVGKITIETNNVTFDKAYCARHAGFIEGDFVLLAVSDDGCGMNSDTLSHLFEPFFTTKEMGKGTGLGLASIYGAVKQNNGFINVYSEPGHGTRFTIYIPRFTDELVQETEKRKPQAETRGSETILLVEDEPSILKMATIMLERLGYTVIAAPTPNEAIRLAGEYSSRIDLLMTDVVMPRMNGRDLAKSILSIYPNIRLLFMSGYTANVIAHHSVLEEDVHFIQKPFSMNDLAVKIREALGDE
jgi:PAS domain S-box-containing protein